MRYWLFATYAVPSARTAAGGGDAVGGGGGGDGGVFTVPVMVQPLTAPSRSSQTPAPVVVGWPQYAGLELNEAHVSTDTWLTRAAGSTDVKLLKNAYTVRS